MQIRAARAAPAVGSPRGREQAVPFVGDVAPVGAVAGQNDELPGEDLILVFRIDVAAESALGLKLADAFPVVRLDVGAGRQQEEVVRCPPGAVAASDRIEVGGTGPGSR